MSILKNRLFLILSVSLVRAGLAASFSFAQDGALGRSVGMAFEYPGIEIDAGESFQLELLFNNRGSEDENLVLELVEKSAGWNTAIRSPELTVTGVYLPAGGTKTLTLRADPPINQKPGQAVFRVRARSHDGLLVVERALVVAVKEKRVQASGTTGIGLVTSYPVLRGASDAGFEFSLEMENKMDQDSVFDLISRAPEGWEVNFKPAYEPRYISSFQLKARQSRKLSVEVKPPVGVRAGEYPIVVRTSSGDAYAETTLTVVLTGTYELSASTASGSLSLGAVQGRPATVSIFVRNTGTAPQGHIGLLSYKPENWTVDFLPDRIDNLEPGQTRQVDVVITPDGRALVGDYSVEIRANGEKAVAPVEFRITVSASTVFGWVGIGIIILVIAGLAALFRWLGRR